MAQRKKSTRSRPTLHWVGQLFFTLAMLTVLLVALLLCRTLLAQPSYHRERPPAFPPSSLRASVIAAGDYLVRQQLPNGDLAFQVNIHTGQRIYAADSLRLMGGTGALFTVCRVVGVSSYCSAGDRALAQYLHGVIPAPNGYFGACLVTNDACQLGGTALTIDTIYKRWQATGSTMFNGRDLRGVAEDLGTFILSLRRPGGGFYHSLDPFVGGKVDAEFSVPYFPGESVLALIELYDMTGKTLWLDAAREVNAYMITQPITQDHWHSYALAHFARMHLLTDADLTYGTRIAKEIVAKQEESLLPRQSTIVQATRVEALSALAQMLFYAGENTDQLATHVAPFLRAIQNRQVPNNDCAWTFPDAAQQVFQGGIFSTCNDATIRVDGLLHWINGVTAFLEYQALLTGR